MSDLIILVSLFVVIWVLGYKTGKKIGKK